MKKSFLFTVALAMCAVLPPATASTWPERQIRLIVPFPAGGAADLFGRLVGAELTEALGQQVVVDNRAGAGGNIGAREAATAPADGYTLFLGTIGTQAINPSLYDNIPYDTRTAFTPVAMVGTIPNVLVVTPSLPATSVEELTALAKSEPGKLNVSSSGNGSSIHLSAELYKHLAQVDITHVPYRGGAAALTDLVGGRVQLMFDNLPTSLALIQEGKLRALAVTGSTRSAKLPDVPTMVEAGVEGYEATAWSGVFVPAGTPEAIVERLNEVMAKALESDKIQTRYRDIGGEAVAMSQPDFARFVDAEYEKWANIVKLSGAKAE